MKDGTNQVIFNLIKGLINKLAKVQHLKTAEYGKI